MKFRRKRLFILKRGKPQECQDLKQWMAWCMANDNTVEYTTLREPNKRGHGGVYVSTVFLAINHNFSDKGDPVLWETMIFGGPYNDYQARYTSLRAAKKGHKYAVALAQGEKRHA